MPRYFIEVAYMGTSYSGFQVQQNANTIQGEIQHVLKIFYRKDFELSGSSRTDAGVHALQNFFHFDTDADMDNANLYSLNALLNPDIVIKKILAVLPDANCRFDAVSRTYCYYISRNKNPFLYGRSYYYPFTINSKLLNDYAAEIIEHTDFTAFSKRHTRVKHFRCRIKSSHWTIGNDVLKYEIQADRFLRGMVKALTGTMLRLARYNKPIVELQNIIASKDCSKADFSPPSEGLFLKEINFKPGIFLSA